MRRNDRRLYAPSTNTLIGSVVWIAREAARRIFFGARPLLLREWSALRV
jgi:hypothetical protein